MTSGYFVDKARAAFAKAGGNPDNSGPLATWAEQAREIGDSRRGCIVTDKGVIVAETRHTPATASTPGATYVTSDGDLAGREVGLAMGALRRTTGRPVIHVKFWEVCEGAGRFVS
jgi:hypothetical protein